LRGRRAHEAGRPTRGRRDQYQGRRARSADRDGLVFADRRGKLEEGTAAAERLISQGKVVTITGEFHSSVFLAEMEVAHKAGIPIIAVDVWALSITAKGYPEVFRVAPNQALIATKYGDWIAAAGFKNVA